MKATTMLDTLSSLLGTPVRAIPLSSCHILRPYLLERAEIATTGTALFFTIPYVMTADVDDPGRNLSLYAVPRDYHGYVTELGAAILPVLRDLFPAHRFALFADHSPVAEVDGAARAGLGVRGDNGLLITPEYGSFVFIATLCTDADHAAVTGAPPPTFPDQAPTCEGCGACRRACPTGALGGDGICLSRLTQQKGELTADEQVLLTAHPLVWGCDTCQMVCPHNRRVVAAGQDTPVAYFRHDRLPRLTVPVLDAMGDDPFAARAYAWRGRAVIRRNLLLHHLDKEENAL